MSESERGARLGRYTDLGLIGRGGMAVVHRVWDPLLQRSVAMKIGHFVPHDAADAMARFRDEAQATAQLQHPGVVAVHEMGVLDDGRAYFTMKEIVGRTLEQSVAEVHRASTDAAGLLSFRRLLDAFHQVCQAVAYAHVRGVIHRDIKPTNIMIGEYGEVLVVDWGLAKVVRPGGAGPRLQLEHRDADAYMTLDGEVMGTPMYMSPEQAEGASEELGPRSDVYSLGAVLFQVLSGKPPFLKRTLGDLLIRVMEGQTEPLVGRFPIPDALAELCVHAMARDPANRPADAGELADRLGSWLQGETGRERARALVASAEATAPKVAALRAEAAALHAEVAALAVPLSAPLADRRRAWAVEDRADALLREAELEEVRAVQALRSALEHAELPEARDRLAAYYLAEAVAAEERRDELALSAALAQLTAYDRGQHRSWISGQGALTLVTDPPAEARLYRYALQDRRLVPVFERELGRTPLIDVELAAGSYLVTLRAEGGPELAYPVRVRRGARWESAGPDGAPVRLPQVLGPDEVAVLAGPCLLGGDPLAPRALPRQTAWVQGFAMQKYPVSNADYLAFINDLALRGQADEAMRHSPRVGSGPAQPYPWTPQLPLHYIDAYSAEAYAAWLSARTGLPWRLPTEREREKAARGADGRCFPWGDFFDPTFCGMADTPRMGPGPEQVGARDLDESPYGIRGLAGNVREWCADPWTGDGGAPDPRARVVRGGTWQDSGEACRGAARVGLPPATRDGHTGFRLVRSLL